MYRRRTRGFSRRRGKNIWTSNVVNQQNTLSANSVRVTIVGDADWQVAPGSGERGTLLRICGWIHAAPQNTNAQVGAFWYWIGVGDVNDANYDVTSTATYDLEDTLFAGVLGGNALSGTGGTVPFQFDRDYVDIKAKRRLRPGQIVSMIARPTGSDYEWSCVLRGLIRT